MGGSRRYVANTVSIISKRLFQQHFCFVFRPLTDPKYVLLYAYSLLLRDNQQRASELLAELKRTSVDFDPSRLDQVWTVYYTYKNSLNR